MVPYTALILDGEYNIRVYGDAASTMFGFDQQTIIGQHVEQILPALGSQLKHMLQTSQPIQISEMPMQAKRANGNSFPVMVGMRQDQAYGNDRHVVLVRNLEHNTIDGPAQEK